MKCIHRLRTSLININPVNKPESFTITIRREKDVEKNFLKELVMNCSEKKLPNRWTIIHVADLLSAIFVGYLFVFRCTYGLLLTFDIICSRCMANILDRIIANIYSAVHPRPLRHRIIDQPHKSAINNIGSVAG